MISIRLKDYYNPPSRLVDATSRNQIIRACESEDGSKCYGNYKEDSVRELLKAYSIGKTDFDSMHDRAKCFYCESQGEESGQLEVEHYRPKDGVNKNDIKEGKKHPGYYWLGNEWSNHLLSCRACNGSGAKGTRFPIARTRVFHPPGDFLNNLDRTDCIISSPLLLSEAPLLLNPEYDTPEDHLTFDETGQIYPKGESERGGVTIDILNLKRQSLQIARRKIIDSFVADIYCLILKANEGLISDNLLLALLIDICLNIQNRANTHVAYTLWGRYINENFDAIFVSSLPKHFQKILKTAYDKAQLKSL